MLSFYQLLFRFGNKFRVLDKWWLSYLHHLLLFVLNPVTPNTPANPETNTTKPATNSSNNHTDNIINNIVSAINNEVNKIVSNENKIVSNSTESNVNVGTDSSQEAKTGDSEKSVHELLDKDVSKQTQINPLPFIIVLIIVFAVLIFGYYRYKKNE